MKDSSMLADILVISTYPELTQGVKRIAGELNIDCKVYEGGILKNGHTLAARIAHRHKVIVSQGGTAEAIRKLVSIPVIGIETGVGELLRAMQKARDVNKRIALISNMNEKLEELYDLRVPSS